MRVKYVKRLLTFYHESFLALSLIYISKNMNNTQKL